MKRKDLEKRIRQMIADAEVEAELTEAKRHSAWKIGANKVTVPRHNEIGEGLSAAIVKQVAAAIAAAKEGIQDAT